MPILNYTTTVEAEKSVGEIIAKLGAKGAQRISQEYKDGKIVAIGFTYEVGGIPVYFKLPSNEAGVLAVLKKTAEPRWRTPEQARRVAWRILKDWIDAQLAFVEAAQAEMGQVFMPYAETHTGETMYQMFLGANQQKALGTGNR